MMKLINKIVLNWNYGYWLGVLTGWIIMYLALKILIKF